MKLFERGPLCHLKSTTASASKTLRFRVPLGASVASLDVASAKQTGRALVVAVDDTALSWQAVRYAMDELYRSGDVLHLLHVIPRDSARLPVPPPFMGNFGYSSECIIGPEEMENALAEYAEMFIAQSMATLVDSCSAKCQVEIVRSSSSRDSIGEAICKASDRLRASIIIVPGHRKTGLVDRIFKPEDHAAFGTYVASHSGRPTLIYQPPVEDNILMEQQSSSQQPVSRPSEVGLQMPV